MLRDLLDGAEPITTPAGRTGLARQARAGWAPGAVLLGDAAASTDPLTAGGLAHALVTAERLAAAVPAYLACAADAAQADAALARFDRERRRLLRPHAWLTRGLVAIVRKPLLARATLHVMRAVPPLMRQPRRRRGGDVDSGAQDGRRQLEPGAGDQQRDRPEGDTAPPVRIAVAAARDAHGLPHGDRRQQQRRQRHARR